MKSVGMAVTLARVGALVGTLLGATAGCGNSGNGVVATGDAGVTGDTGADVAVVMDTTPTCTAAQMLCGGACVNVQSDNANCGGCGMACPAGQACAMGHCGTTCPAGQMLCGSACVTLASDPANCGGCGMACPAGQACSMGHCGTTCPMGQMLCGSACVNVQSDNTNCGMCGMACPAGQACAMGHCGTTCAPGQMLCAGTCATLASDPANCGMCGMACPTGANATAFCTAGACGLACAAGYGDCDGNPANGCETALNTTTRCGACGIACAFSNAAATCGASGCALGACTTGFADCDHNPANGCEANTQTDSAHCGGCATACGASAVCSAGVCGVTCGAGLSVCGGGCANLATDPSHCGACATACATPAHGVGVCAASTCGIVCLSGYADCNRSAADGCEANLATDASHCGGCGTVCSSNNGTPSCAAGACAIACTTGFADCDHAVTNGCEVGTQTDAANCGSCGNACPAGAHATGSCAAGVCGLTCAAGYGDCDGNPTNGCETSLTTTSACGVCGGVCPAGAVCATGSCVIPRTCAVLHTLLPSLVSGNYTIDPDGPGGRAPYLAWCDMTTAGGGWTVIFLPTTTSYNSTTLDYTNGDATLMGAATETLTAFRTDALAVVGDWARFPLPVAWRSQSPFRYPQANEAVMVSVTGAAPVSSTLVYGFNNWPGCACDTTWVGPTTQWGRLCIVGSTAPFYSGWGVGTGNYCSNDSTSCSAATCTATRQFTIAVR